jgi:hypothetical protein
VPFFDPDGSMMHSTTKANENTIIFEAYLATSTIKQYPGVGALAGADDSYPLTSIPAGMELAETSWL